MKTMNFHLEIQIAFIRRFNKNQILNCFLNFPMLAHLILHDFNSPPPKLIMISIYRVTVKCLLLTQVIKMAVIKS